MTRFGAVLGAVAVALFVTSVANATVASDSVLVRKGIAAAEKKRWVQPEDAIRYRAAVSRAVYDAKRLPKLRALVIASQVSQVKNMWQSYTSPRALALFSQLEFNLEYLETHRIPPGGTDVRDDEGVLYRWFNGQGLEFHPLGAFGALNAAAASQDPETTQVLAQALVARGVPRQGRLVWEYSFRFGSGRPPWTSGMAQAVAAQALARAGALVQDPSLIAAAARAYQSIGQLTQLVPAGTWIKLYSFNREIVLNAQLQAILSLYDYGDANADAGATALADTMKAATETMLPQFDTGDWSLYELGGFYAPKSYQLFVTQLLQKLAKRTQEPFWLDAYARFRSYYYDPPVVTQTTPTVPTYLPGPVQIQVDLSQKASLTLAVGGRLSTYKLQRGPQTITWTPPADMQPGTYQAQIAAKNYAGRTKTTRLAPIELRSAAAPSPVEAHLEGTTLVWASSDTTTPWLLLRVDLVDAAGTMQSIDLGQQPLSGSAGLTVPPGTWTATLSATNAAGLVTTVPLGTLTGAG